MASQERQEQAVNQRDSDYGRKGQMARCIGPRAAGPLDDVERYKCTSFHSHAAASRTGGCCYPAPSYSGRVGSIPRQTGKCSSDVAALYLEYSVLGAPAFSVECLYLGKIIFLGRF